MNSSVDILEKIKDIIEKKAPLAKVYLYGSRARGTAHEESDWDILILLKRDNITSDIESEITNPLYDLEFDTGEVISPMIYTEKDWNSKYKITPFYNIIMREGKLL